MRNQNNEKIEKRNVVVICSYSRNLQVTFKEKPQLKKNF